MGYHFLDYWIVDQRWRVLNLFEVRFLRGEVHVTLFLDYSLDGFDRLYQHIGAICSDFDPQGASSRLVLGASPGLMLPQDMEVHLLILIL